MACFKSQITITVLLLLAAAPVFGQSAKRKISVSDYVKWSTLQDEAISPDGKWISYGLQYDYGPDTLFVQNCSTGQKFIFPEGSGCNFSDDGKFATVSDPERGLILQDLTTGKNSSYKDVVKHEFFTKGKYLAILSKTEKADTLKIMDYAHNNIYTFERVQDFSIAANGKVAITTGHEVRIIDPESKFAEKTIAQDGGGNLKTVFWDHSGTALAILQEHPKDNLLPVGNSILYYNLKDAKLSVLEAGNAPELRSGRIIKRLGTPALAFSPDDKRLFFAFTTPHEPIGTEPVEIWDSATPLEYHQDIYHGNTEYEPKLAVWSMQSGKVVKIGTNKSPKAILTEKPDYALCYDILKYEPQYEYYAPADIYLKNTVTGIEKLILEKQPLASVGCSPKGRYIHYFSNGNWYVYDIKKGTYLNLTSGLNLSLIDEHDNYSGPEYPYECAGWSSDDKYLVVYDKYDIWLLSPDGKVQNKMTDGSKNKTRFRISGNLYLRSETQSNDRFLIRGLDLSKGLVLEALGENMESGYFLRQPDGSIKKMVYGESGKSRIRKSAAADNYIFVEQAVALPPRIMLLNGNQSVANTVVQTNPQAKDFKWASAELVGYKNKEGKSLKGILYKPAGYIAGKKYPMVVFIYEKLSDGLYNYYKPTEYQSMGFCPAHFFLDGYLVLYPDIAYRMGDPGLSAAECVESAVSAVKAMGIVEENHIGLIGHSFGGYETAFIISQTNTFAAAVSGSGVTNLISSYFTFGSDVARSNAWRYETQQYRMAGSPFDDWKAYESNAPLPNAATINTPLLSWAGKHDQSVFWTQSAELHMALRRLKKKNLFLVYTTEPHNILTPELQLDITRRTKNWFDYYLKGKSAAQQDSFKF